MKSIYTSKIAILAVLFLFISLHSIAQKNFFKPAPDLIKSFPGKSTLDKFSLFRLNETALRAYLKNAPAEFQNSNRHLLIQFPLPGGAEVFDIKESSILSSQVASEHPEIKTYTGKGQVHKNYSISMSFTSSGLNAIILGLEGNEIYIEHVEGASKNVYVIYYGRDAKRRDGSRRAVSKCGALPSNSYHPFSSSTFNPSNPTGITSTGGTLRIFKLAVAATAEFTAAKGGTQAAAFNALVAYVNRLTAVYRMELSVSFTLVSGTNVVYTTPGVPYTNSNQTAMLAQNQTNLDAVIGNANYDVGHVLGYSGGSGGGLAVAPSACISAEKAQGVSGLGDGSFAAVFDDQLFSHEVGHQYSMSHSYNSSIPVCTTREPTTSVEPGAGTTMMSYGFTCSDATGNDDYEAPYQPFLNFHTVNYKQAADYINTLTCFTTTNTGNNPPVITVMPTNKTIPKSTPFQLTGTATDANAGDVLSYSWEGTNIGTETPTPATLANTAKPPFFRSYAPVATSSRMYPRLSAILNGTNYAKGDKLPSVGIVTTHRLTVRDNQDGSTFGDVSVTIDANSGPFQETTNLSGVYASGSTHTITWDVANTTSAPVSCPNVDILLSTDGGQTFPTILAASTPNTGSKSVAFPYLSNTTTTARIKVMASNNIFFDISNNNFTINLSPLPLSLLNIQASKQGSDINVAWNTVSESDLVKYDIEYSTDGVQFTTIGNVSARNTAGPSTYNFLHLRPVAGINYYRLHIISLAGIDKFSQVVIVNTSKSEISVNVYPNPVNNGTLALQFNNLPADVYTVSLYNMLSQRLLDHVINHTGGSNNIFIKLNSIIIPGTYELVISGSKGNSYKQKLIVE